MEQALGQYNLYFNIIDLSELEYILYLAISEYAYKEFFEKAGASQIIERMGIKLIVVDIDDEEVVQWKE